MEETLLSLALGLGLAAACGFRVFVPFLVMGAAVRTGHLDVSPGFEWVGTDAALIAFAAATVLEIAGYYVPWVDNLLDTVATPAALVAGILVTASVVTDASPLVRWTLAVLAGGAAAASVQALTVAARQLSSFATAGLGNAVIATGETVGAVAMALMAILLPLAALAVLLVLLAVAVRWVFFGGPRRGARSVDPNGSTP
ncbi:MAG TPA: DUF4126 domain-containing protein [Thermoanaerobaculia bacterium]|nr:DUF4126 domain-containing protein [Thermoanaerobaculia bacterium]